MIAIDAGNCMLKWRAKIEHEPSLLGVNRGVAYADGTLSRGTQDGRVVAYDAEDGSLLWEREIAEYALDADKGEELWSRDLGGAVGGGVITYEAGGKQRVAFAYGMTSPIWPTTKTTGKIAVFGLAAEP